MLEDGVCHRRPQQRKHLGKQIRRFVLQGLTLSWLRTSPTINVLVEDVSNDLRSIVGEFVKSWLEEIGKGKQFVGVGTWHSTRRLH